MIRFRPSPFGCTLAGGLAGAVSPALAEPPDWEDLEQMSLSELLQLEVTTATRDERSVAEVPATVHLVTRDTIEARGYRTLADVLEDIPEIQVAFKVNEEAPTWVTIRGVSGNDKFVILRDGVRATAVSGRPEPILQNYSLFDVERIEVVLGPASALYGADAFSGVVNVITSRGSDLEGGRVTGSYGMFRTTHDGFVWGDALGDLELAVSAQLYHSDEPDLSELYPDDYRAFRAYRRTGELEGFGGPVAVEDRPWEMPYDAWSISSKANLGELEIRYFRSAQRFVPAYSAAIAQTTFSDEAQYYLDHREIVSATHRHTVGTERPVVFETSLSRMSSRLAPGSGFSNIFTNYERFYKAEWGVRVTAQELVHLRLAEGYTLSTGLSYDDLVGMPKTTDLDRPYDDKLPTGSQGAVYPGTDIPISFYVIHERNFGATFQLQAELLPSVQLTVGSRYDRNSRFGGTINPRAGVVLQPIRKLTAKLLYGEAFLSPTHFASFLHYGSFSCTAPDQCDGGYFHVPNPDLEPEKLRTGELSIVTPWTDDLVTSLSGFYTRISNRIDIAGEIATEPFLGVENVAVQPSVNRGTMDAYGGTARAEVRVPVGALTLKPSASYTFTAGDIELDNIDHGLPNAAPHVVKAALEARCFGLVLAPRLVFLSETSTTLGLSVPASWVVDLAGRYDDVFGSERVPVDVFFGVTNLFDRRYYHAPGVDNHDFTVHRNPQDPIRVDAGVSIGF